MSFITIEHSNPNAVTRKLENWSRIQKGNLVMETVGTKLDELYQIIYRVTPVKTGYMRSTLTVRGGADYRELVVTARYAWYVHQGRSPRGPRRPQPFFMPNVVAFSAEIIIAVRMLFMTIR